MSTPPSGESGLQASPRTSRSSRASRLGATAAAPDGLAASGEASSQASGKDIDQKCGTSILFGNHKTVADKCLLQLLATVSGERYWETRHSTSLNVSRAAHQTALHDGRVIEESSRNRVICEGLSMTVPDNASSSRMCK
jgi:hypothetical protein